MKGGIAITAFFVAGTLCGLWGLLPVEWFTGGVSFYALCALMFCVGVGIGHDPHTVRSFRTLSLRFALLPVFTIAGTLAGAALAGALLAHRTVFDCMAVGSGFAYYSLSSIFITEYKGVELGTVALLSNISREIITLLCAPLLARLFGRLAPISSGGATTMDTTLPVITRCSGREFVVLSIFHGLVVDFSVPFLVTFFCSL